MGAEQTTLALAPRARKRTTWHPSDERLRSRPNGLDALRWLPLVAAAELVPAGRWTRQRLRWCRVQGVQQQR